MSLLCLAVALLGGLTFSLLSLGPDVQGQLVMHKSAELVAQGQLIVHRLSKCATDHPTGDNGTALHKAYPRDAGPGPLAAAALVCPGSNQNLWSGVDGVYGPAPIPGFESWTYTNGSPAVIRITTLQPATYGGAIAAAAQRLGLAAAATTSNVAGDTLTVKLIE